MHIDVGNLVRVKSAIACHSEAGYDNFKSGELIVPVDVRSYQNPEKDLYYSFTFLRENKGLYRTYGHRKDILRNFFEIV